MANDDYDEFEDDVNEEPEDNAAALTSGLVLTTSLLLFIAIGIVFTALDTYFQVGPLADK